MTQSAINLVEQRFRALRRDTPKEDWDSVDYIFAQALELEATDVALARRVMQRAKNLEPENKQVRAELKRLAAKVSKLKPDSETSSSEDKPKPVVAETVISSEGSATDPGEEAVSLSRQEQWKERLKAPWFLFMVLPILLFAFYQLVWASDRYESRSKVIVQQPNDMAAMDPSMALLSGFGLSTPASTDGQLVQAFIYSEDMLKYLDEKLQLRLHYTDSGADIFSRLSSSASREEFLEFYLQHVSVEIDEKSSVISVRAQAFTPEYAFELSRAIVERAEWYINSLGHKLATEQVKFVRGEHQIIEQRLDKAKRQLLSFQQRYNLLDPEAEGMALQQIAYGLESQLAAKKAELKSLRSVMSDSAPQVMVARSQIRALEAQLENERERLSLQQRQQSGNDGVEALKPGSPISEVLAKFTELKVELELALQAYTASEVSLEKSRIEAYRQLKYLMVVESSTYPEDNQYPEVVYNITLFSLIVVLMFGIARIVVATVNELR